MELTTRESALISYALNMLSITSSPVNVATRAEINDLSARVITETIKETRKKKEASYSEALANEEISPETYRALRANLAKQIVSDLEAVI